jgi:hypothetical protein
VMTMWRGLGRRMGAAMLVATVVLVQAGSPASAQPRVRVHPTTDLVDQQQVRVAVSGFPFEPGGENRIAVIQCAAEATDVTGCGDFTSINSDLDARGSVRTRYRVSRILRTPALGTIDCAAAPQRCLIVVATLDLTQIITVPISFDPTVPPLPPVDIGATLDPSATVNPHSGVVTISGTVTCTVPTPIQIVASVAQQQGEMQILGFVDTIVECSDNERWSFRVRSSTPGTSFTEGLGLVGLNFTVDRSGPRESVELFAPELPLIAQPPH